MVHKPSQGPIGSAVVSIIGYKQTNRQTNKKTDRQAKYIDVKFKPLPEV